MALTDEQIERYSRQILVTGGVAQERLLTSRIVVVGAANEVEMALRYLVGAGVGTIGLDLLGERDESRAQLIARVRELNSGVAIQSEEPDTRPDLRLMIISNANVLRAVKSRSAGTRDSALVVARLDSPAKIAVFPDPSSAVEKELFARWRPSTPHYAIADNAGFVTMVAVTEVLKLLTEARIPTEPVMIDLDGYQTKTRSFARH